MNINKIIKVFEFEKLEAFVLNYFPYTDANKIKPVSLFVKFVLDQYYKRYDSLLWNMPISDFYDFTKYFYKKHSGVSIMISIFNYYSYKKNGSLAREYTKYETGFVKRLLADPDINLDDSFKMKLKLKYNI